MGADCQRDDWGYVIAPIQSARSTQKTHLITFEKAFKNKRLVIGIADRRYAAFCEGVDEDAKTKSVHG